MKFLKGKALLSFCIVGLVVSPFQLLTASAQNPSAASSAQNDSPAVNQLSATSDSRDAARLKREQAYVKLLEGQRLLVRLRTGGVEAPAVAATVKQAQVALQEATKLDSTLAEAYTALAEIALFYPPRNMDEAVRQANVAIGISRDNLGGHQMLSRIYALRSGLSSQRLDNAVAEKAIIALLEVTRLAPNDAEAWALLGELYLALGRTNEAITALTRWSAAPAAVNAGFFQTITGRRELTPDAAAARLGEALLRSGRRREAIAAIRRALSLNPQNEKYSELLAKAVEAVGEDDESVIAELRNTIAAEPQGTAAPILLARVLARAGKEDEAVQTLRNAISRRDEMDKENILSLRMALGQTFADLERYSEGVAVYEAILLNEGIKPDVPLEEESDKRFAGDLLRRIIALYKSARKSKEAIATLDRMRRYLGSNDSTIDLEEIQLLRDLGKRGDALKMVKAARLRFPQQSDFVYLEAILLTELGKVDEGVMLLRSRLSQEVNTPKTKSSSLADVDLYLRISGIYMQAGKVAEAVAAARQALDLAPADRPDIVSVALITLSSAQERAGDAKGSEESLRRVLASDPDNATALNNLGYFLVERNERLNEALEMIQRAVDVEPTNSSFLDSLGWVYFKLGQLDQAERHLTEAARRRSTSATIHEHLGDLYHAQGKKAQAWAAWQKSLKLLSDGEQASRIKSKLGKNPK